jgi:hypothetical protein
VNELPDSSLLASAKMLENIQSQLNSTLFELDTRTPEKHQAEVDAYIAKATKALPGVIMKRTCERHLGLIRLAVQNNTDDQIRQLQVVLTIPAKGVMALTDADLPDVSMPSRPVALGQGSRSRFPTFSSGVLGGLGVPRYDYLTPAMRSLGRGVRIVRENRMHGLTGGSWNLSVAMATGTGQSWGDPRGSRRGLPLISATAPALDPTVTPGDRYRLSESTDRAGSMEGRSQCRRRRCGTQR